MKQPTKAPVQSQAQTAPLRRQESGEIEDDQRPAMHAKQSKPASNTESVQPVLSRPAQNLESEAEKQAKIRQQQAELEAAKQRQINEEKIQKMKIIHEQQKAKKAAEKAAAAA